MVDPELDSGFVYDIYDDIHITRLQFFDVGFGFDDTIEDYLNRILPTLVDVIDDQFQDYDWILPRSSIPAISATADLSVDQGHWYCYRPRGIVGCAEDLFSLSLV
ncbi:hypothetical protein MA16_Dca023579 [Dendrobium catenatum]|uniref:Uncharacterized protein n=1 Tax=Dendrobium catenatum TaxID=906689 RepID=A0A2I0XIJ3_9ASPA|nr:hypothetical protein MA16_Dca023579 [Dendrobium catenatum]